LLLTMLGVPPRAGAGQTLIVMQRCRGFEAGAQTLPAHRSPAKSKINLNPLGTSVQQ
jgi:hypothetical protein